MFGKLSFLDKNRSTQCSEFIYGKKGKKSGNIYIFKNDNSKQHAKS